VPGDVQRERVHLRRLIEAMSRHWFCPDCRRETHALPATRRAFLSGAAGSLAGVALASLAANAAAAESVSATNIDPVRPLAERPPHFAPTAKRVICLFMNGAPSQVDTFDYKPELQKLGGQPVPESIKEKRAGDAVGGVFKHCKDELLASPFKFAQHGQSGLWVSEILPHLARRADDLCVIRSMTADSSNHAPATYQMNTGAVLGGRPSMGSWITYGLGSENQDLPGYVLLFDVGPFGGAANHSAAFLPGAFQGTRFYSEGDAVLNLRPPPERSDTQRSTYDFIGRMNAAHRAARSGFDDLDARIASYELAYRMQSEALDLGDFQSESADTLAMYGVDDQNEDTAKYARKCLMARRLVEKGVRFVQVYNTMDGYGWDAHGDAHDVPKNHGRNAAQVDKPAAALLADLAQRGLLDDTLVLWLSEFGRTPMLQGDKGRNHCPYGFSVWLAGGGVRGGQAIGATDEIGLRAVVDPYRPKDLHATILAALGLRCDDLFFETAGRQERLTGVAGTAKPIPGVLG
jgi:hypothetical protein